MSLIETTVPQRPVSPLRRRRPETDPLAGLDPSDLALLHAYQAEQRRVANKLGFTHYLRVFRSESEGGHWEVHIHPDEFAYQLAQEGRFFGYHVGADKEVHFWPVSLPALLTVLRTRTANDTAKESA